MIASPSFEARADDGWVLRGDVLGDAAAPPIVAVLAHAMMVTRRTMNRGGNGLASELAAAGITVVNADLRGHGDSGPRADEGGSFTYDDFVLRDVPALVSAARARFAGARVVVVGHSLGAHTAAIAAGVDPARAPDALVSIAGNVWVPKLDPSLLRRIAKRAVFEAWLAGSARRGYFDSVRFRVGTVPEPLAYIRQFVAMYRNDRIASVDGVVDYEAALGRATLPILSIASDGDRLLAHPDCVERFFALAGAARVERRRVRGSEFGRGGAPSHMGLVTDARSRGIWQEVAAWIRGVSD